MKSLYPLCVLFLLTSCAEEKKEAVVTDRTKTDWATYKFEGNVKSVSEKSYETTDGQQKGKTRHENLSAHDYDLTFNENGMLIAEKQWIDGTVPYTERKFNGKEKVLEELKYIQGSPSIKKQNTYDKNGNITGTIRRNHDNTQLDRTQMTYDGKNLMEKKTFSNQDTPNGKITYIYDRKGNLKGENIYLDSEYVQAKNLFQYDSQNRKIAETSYSKDKVLYTTEYEYSGKNLIRKETKDADGKLLSSEKTAYDEKGNPVARYSYDSYDNAETKDEFIYDKNNNLIQWNLARNNAKEMQVDYTYDGHNNITATKAINGKGEIMDDHTYTYEYDKEGNWTKKIISVNGKPAIITERTFTYFGE